MHSKIIEDPGHPRYFVYSLAKGISILKVFSQQTSPLSLTEVANLNQMNLPTASRYLRTFADLGYVVLDSSTKKYLLTNKVLSLGLGFLHNMDLRMRVHPYLVNLSREFNVSAQCSILDETDIVFVERTRGTGLVDFNLTAGSRLPAYCTAMGRAILAHLPPEKANHLIDQMDLKARTPFTITSKQKLLAELERVRRQGYAQNVQEVALGYVNYAAPIFNNEKVESAIGASFSLAQHKGNRLVPALIAKLLKASKEVSIVF
jgi:IclR family transcriptional regulator, pca regulon regulatory protein